MRVTIYISLWTNYNRNYILFLLGISTFTFHYELIITGTYKTSSYITHVFTFHYELIITVKDYVIDEDELIYISLWTNYNKM